MAGQDLQRREILRIMALAAAAAPFPGFTKWAFAFGHGNHGMEQIRPAQYKPHFFSDSEYVVVERLAELIIPSDQTPGAREAGVAEFIDFMISRDHDQQFKFRTGIHWLNAHSERLLGKPFAELSEQDQISILEPLAYKAKHRAGEEDGREFFGRMRDMTAMGFYTTEIGYKELDNPALKFYAESPECPHKDDPEHKHLPPPKY